MRIAIGSVTYPLLNGVTTSIDLSVDGLVKAGHQVIIVSPTYGQGRVRPEHRPASTSLVSRLLLHAFGKKERLFSLKAYREIGSLLVSFSPEICWLHTVSWAENAFEKAMLASPAKKVLTYHTMVEDYGRVYAGKLGGSVMKVRSRDLANQMDAVIVPSRVIGKRLLSYGVTRPISIIPTGVTIPDKGYNKAELAVRFHFLPDCLLLLYVGRVSKEKNIFALLWAVKTVNQQRPATLLLVGPGDIEHTEKLAEQLGISRQVICAGPLAKEDTQKIYAGADIFLFASQTETQGLVIGEAMLSGTPVVATKSPIQPEVYPEGVATVVDKDEQLGKAVLELAKDTAKTKQIRQVGKQFVRSNFSVKNMTERQILLFSNLFKK